jgi:serine/threonine-protein kinase
MSAKDTNSILFEKFEIIDCLKKDDAGAVYLARHLYLKKEIILKTLEKSVITESALISRFMREARILAGIDHPNVIKVLDFGKHKDSLYISFEYFAGKNLRQLINENKINDDQRSVISDQMIAGMAAVHRAGIIHRDLKPENILVGPEMNIKIADFGLAQAPDEMVVTQKSSIVGTPGYMSPEQVRGEKLTAASDVFALGIIIFELYNKKNPLVAKDLNTTLNKILQFNYDNIANDIADLPGNVQTILKDALQNQSTERCASAVELNNQIQSGTNEQENLRISRSKLVLVIISIVIVAIITVIIWNHSNSDEMASATPDASLPVMDTSATDTSRNKQAGQIQSSHTLLTNELTPEKKQESGERIEQNSLISTGVLAIRIQPAAQLAIDSGTLSNILSDTTMKLETGKHTLRFLHASYPVLYDTINVRHGEITTHTVNLESLCAYFHCEVYPWGEIFINNQYFAQTPFFTLIRLAPGKNTLEVRNPDFREYRKALYLNRGDTLKLKINLEETVNNR